MAIYYLPYFSEFPDPSREDVDDLLAIGGDLRPERLIAAYRNGIFPWYSEESPVLWWSPDPRLILEPQKLHIPRRLQRLIMQDKFKITVNMDFPAVIRSCAQVPRHGSAGTWIVPDMIKAYIRLHNIGYAHSVEVWQQDRLVGGIYGVAMGRAFFGESMFHIISNASKIALVTLVLMMRHWGYRFMDCQQTTRHMLQFGAEEIKRKEFMKHLKKAVQDENLDPGIWLPRSVSIKDFL